MACCVRSAAAVPRSHGRRHAAVAFAAVAATLAYGAARLHDPTPAAAASPPALHLAAAHLPHLRHAASELPLPLPSLRVSCLVRNEDASPALPDEALWARTAARVAAGDDIILWSETAATAFGPAGERELLARAADVASQGRSYLGVAYELAPDAGEAAQAASLNAFALLRPGVGAVNASAHGALAFRYLKSHVVPLVESGFAHGSRRLRFEEAPFGRTTAAICFDSDFPALIRQAGAHAADVLLQPSQTWGPASFRLRHAYGNGLRAVENGYTLVRCASDGVSGAIGPRLERLAWEASGSEGVVLMTLPPPSLLRRRTAYATAGGWLFGWACVLAASLAAVAVAAPERALPRRWRAAPPPPALRWHEADEADEWAAPLVAPQDARCAHHP
jgi:apolipoprotein N-acyltransferase